MAVDPNGRGYYLNAHTYEEVEVTNHLYDAEEHPERFGLTSDKVERLLASVDGSEREKRRVVIGAVLQQGWIRLRNHSRRGEWSIEYWATKDDAKFLRAIRDFGEDNFGPLVFLEINNVARSTGTSQTWMEFEEAWEAGDYEELMPGSSPSFAQRKDK